MATAAASFEQTAAALGDLLGAGRGVGDLAQVVAHLSDRLRAVEQLLEAAATGGAGLGRAAATAKFDAIDGRLDGLERATAAHEAELEARLDQYAVLTEDLAAGGEALATLVTEVRAFAGQTAGLADEVGATARRAAGLEAAVIKGNDRLHAAEGVLAGLTAQVAEAKQGTVQQAAAARTLSVHLTAAERALDEHDKRVTALDLHLAALVEGQRRSDAAAETLAALQERVQGLESLTALHATEAEGDRQRVGELVYRAQTVDVVLERLAADVVAAAAQTDANRQRVHELAGRVDVLAEEVPTVGTLLAATRDRVADGERATGAAAEQVAALAGRVEELVAGVDAHATHVAGLESTVRLLVDEQGQAAADDPRLKYMRHTGAPHTPDLYVVQGSQFQQDGVTKVVVRCRHCAYRHAEVVG